MQRPLAFVGALSITVLAVALLPQSTPRLLVAGLNDPRGCPLGKQCCWVLKERECERKEYTPSREQSFPEFCSKATGSHPWFMIYDDCWKGAWKGLPGGGGSGPGGTTGGSAGGPNPGTGEDSDDDGEDTDGDHGGDGTGKELPGGSPGGGTFPYCGNRVTDPGEECDPPGSIILPDGRALSGMACSKLCRVEITKEPKKGDTRGSDDLPPAPVVPPASDLPPPLQPPPPPPAPIPPPISDQREGTDSFLGCYGVDGSWTKDRSLCDLDQARHMRNVTDPETDRPFLPEKTLRNLTEEEEHAIQEALKKQFQEEERFKKKQLELLTLIENTVSRFQIIRDTYGLSEQSSGFLDAAITWLQESAAYFETKRTKDDVAFMAVSVKELLGRVEELVAAERTDGEVARGQEPDIVSLIARTEELTSAFRIGFGVLLREGLELPPEVYAAYGEAATKIADIREHCPRNPSSCSGLNDVLEALSTLKDPLQVGMEEVDADARKEIEAAFVRE